jgi:hypothetical protein
MYRRIMGSIVLSLVLSCAPRTVNLPFHPEILDLPSPGVLHLHCTWTEPYCGGAEPDPDDLPRPRPWQGSMYIRIAHPDSTGRFASTTCVIRSSIPSR